MLGVWVKYLLEFATNRFFYILLFEISQKEVLLMYLIERGENLYKIMNAIMPVRKLVLDSWRSNSSVHRIKNKTCLPFVMK